MSALRWGWMLLGVLMAIATLVLGVKVREEQIRVEQFVRAETRDISPADTEAVALSLSRGVFRRTHRRVPASELSLYERLESTSFLNVSSGVSLGHGAYALVGQPHSGACGTMVRVMLAGLRHRGIAARKLHLLDDPSPEESGHVMVEFRSGGRWLVLSPSDSTFVWRRRDGAIATLEEIKADPAIFAQIYERYPRYPYQFGHTRNIRWEKLPRPVRAAFRSLLGPAAYERAWTPRLYDEPRRLLLLAALFGLAVSWFGTLVTWRARRRR